LITDRVIDPLVASLTRKFFYNLFALLLGSAGGTSVAYSTYEEPNVVSADPDYITPSDSDYTSVI